MPDQFDMPDAVMASSSSSSSSRAKPRPLQIDDGSQQQQQHSSRGRPRRPSTRLDGFADPDAPIVPAVVLQDSVSLSAAQQATSSSSSSSSAAISLERHGSGSPFDRLSPLSYHYLPPATEPRTYSPKSAMQRLMMDEVETPMKRKKPPSAKVKAAKAKMAAKHKQRKGTPTSSSSGGEGQREKMIMRDDPDRQYRSAHSAVLERAQSPLGSPLSAPPLVSAIPKQSPPPKTPRPDWTDKQNDALRAGVMKVSQSVIVDIDAISLYQLSVRCSIRCFIVLRVACCLHFVTSNVLPLV